MTDRLERDDVLRSVDLESLLDAWYPSGRQRRGRMWPCPVHRGQTGHTPPVTVYVGSGGHQRWKCHSKGCGAGGTAIDLAKLRWPQEDFPSILGLLVGRRPDLSPPVVPRVVGPRKQRAHPEVLPKEVVDHLRGCRGRLWSPAGQPGVAYLKQRGLWNPDMLRINGVGYDPGDRWVSRPEKIPRGESITVPVLNLRGKVVTFQARSMYAKARIRWVSPSGDVSPRQPVVHYVAVPEPDPQRPLVLCEGLSDSLSAGVCGYRAMGVLGTAGADDNRLVGAVQAACDVWGQRRVVLCGDNDPGGRLFVESAMAHLRAGSVDATAIFPPEGCKDLNDWLRAHGAAAVSEGLDFAARAMPDNGVALAI